MRRDADDVGAAEPLPLQALSAAGESGENMLRSQIENAQQESSGG